MSKQNQRRNNQQENTPVEEVKEAVIIDGAPEVEVKQTAAPRASEITPSNTTIVGNTKVSNANSELVMFLTTYQEQLKASKSAITDAAIQYSLYEKYISILSKEDPVAARKDLFTMVSFMRDNGEGKGVFDPYNIYRGSSAWSAGAESYDVYRKLSWIFLSAARLHRSELRDNLNFESLSSALTPVQLANLHNFLA